MSQNNGILRPSVLGNNNVQEQASSSANARASELSELTELIRNIAVQTVRSDVTNMVQSLLQPRNEIVTDQTINAEYSNQIDQMDKIPDVVKSLREFSGNPAEFGSWKKGVERVMKIYESQRGSPRYFGILNIIRNKIVGEADIALESYNTPLDFKAIITCLTTHYADKRDLSTLEYQMTCLIQGRQTIQEFYAEVYAHLSLILNKITCLETSAETCNALTRTYREKALDTFIRGLSGDLPRLLGVKGPTDLPEALHLCLKLENQSYRAIHANNYNDRPALPPKPHRPQNVFHKPDLQRTANHSFNPKLAYLPQQNAPVFRTQQQNNYQHQYSPRNNNYNQNNYAFKTNNPPPRPFGPKPPPKVEKMEVDRSLRTNLVNYANRPKLYEKTQYVHPAYQQQKNYHIHTQQNQEQQYNEETACGEETEAQESYEETYDEGEDDTSNDIYYESHNDELKDIHFLE